MFFALGLWGTQSNAQNVTISPQNGSMICALTDTGAGEATQAGFAAGGFGTWIHEQLSLSMTGSNYNTMTDDGFLASHSNHFITGDKCQFSPADNTRTPENYIVADWGGGNLNTGYITISLPKGYRFTSYTFNISHDVSKFGSANFTITQNTPVYMSETDPNSHFATNVNTVQLDASSATVKEFTRTGNDMGNVLYFKTYAQSNGYYAVTFRHIELTFTADADASVDISPSSQVTTGVSMLEVPFTTGKVDFGVIGPGTYQGATRVSYYYNTVSDITANMLLYENESTRAVTAENSFDGTPGLEAYSKAGSITTANNDFFKLSPGNAKEQVYFLETPTFATMSNGDKNPIQFRIVGANVEYSNGSNVTTSYDQFRIMYDGIIDHYVAADGSETNSNGAARWFIDENGHIRTGQNGGTYLTRNSNNRTTTTTSRDQADTYEINSQGNIQIKGTDLWLCCVTSIFGEDYFIFNNSTNQRATINNTNSKTQVAAEASEFTLKVYDAAGNTVVRTETVNSSNTSGSIPLTGLNNDAIKFSVQGTGYVKLKVTVQALNPYIDRMTVVLNDNAGGKDIRMTRTFTADDFSVGGGTFRFYLPTDCVGDYLTITFEDLYSKYGDETYDHTEQPEHSDSRYNFVQSQHYQAFTGDNIYNNPTEAASDVKESVRIAANNGKGQNVRTKVGIVGNQAFRFNNADELSTNSGYMTEYPFTLAKYAAQTNPGAGSFIIADFDTHEVGTTLQDKTFYVFTTDETKYNIAPTTATQHRFYAFYKMIVEVICQDYSPIVDFVKVYDQTCYDNGSGEGTDAFYGVNVTAQSDITAPLASDEATYEAIKAKIANPNGADVPTDMKQILYLDMSRLNGVYHSNSTSTDAVTSFNDLKSKLAANALIFLPTNSTERYDNFAFAKKGEITGSFQAANNIVLTDKQPFFSPYDIQVDAAKYATYTRLITAPKYGQVQNATLMLPFGLSIDGTGKHTNEDGSGTFTINELKAAQDKVEPQGSDVDYGISYFGPITPNDEGQSEANVPYMVKVDEDSFESIEGENFSFVATQKGAKIAKTPAANFVQRLEGVKTMGDVTFINEATYSGKTYPRTANVFYFAKNMFLNIHTLVDYKPTLYVFPFRSVYTYTGNLANKLNWLEISYDEDFADGIKPMSMPANADLMIRSGNGMLEMEALRGQTVTVRSLAGTTVNTVSLNAGDSKTINLPSGVYIVNNVKIIVK